MRHRYITRVATAVAAAGALILTGCSTAEEAPAEPAKDSVVIGLGAAITTLDPAATNTIGTDLSVIGSIYSRLVSRAPDLSLEPDLALSWEQTEPTVWTFELDPAAVFSDGTPLDADVIAWNIDRLLDPAAAFRQASAFGSIVDVIAVDPETVEIHTDVPDYQLPASLSSLFMLEPEFAATGNVATEALGSGPYLLDSFGGGEEVVLSANPDYWGEAPAIENVTFRAIPDESARLSAILAGEIDLVAGIGPKDIASVENAGDLKVESIDSTGISLVKFNTLIAPFDNVLVRQAVNYAVDKQAIADALLGGLVTPTDGSVMTADYDGFFDGLEAYEYDPEKAEELLAEAGYDGSPIEMTIPSGTYMQAEEIGQVIASQLGEVGMTVNIQVLPFAVAQEAYLTEAAMSQMYYIRQGSRSITVGGGYKTLWYSTSAYAYYNSPTFDGLIDSAFAAETEEERNEFLAEAQELMREDAPALFLFPEPGIAALKADLEWSIRADPWVLPAEMSWT